MTTQAAAGPVPSVLGDAPIAEAPAAEATPTETPPATTDGVGGAPVEQPAKPEVKPEAEPAKPEEPKAEETPAEPAKDDEPEYVLASDFDKLKAEYDALKAPKEEPAKAEEAPAEAPPVKEPIDLTKIDPNLIVAPEEIGDDVLEALGIDKSVPEGEGFRAAVAKQFSAISHKAGEYGYQRAKAEFNEALTENVSKMVNVLFNSHDVAKEILTTHPELGGEEEFAKLSKAIMQAAASGKPGTPNKELAGEALRLYNEAGGIVRRFKSDGGKVLRNDGVGAGTVPQQRTGAPAEPVKQAPDPRRVPSVLDFD